jgi:hypothetical protein
MQRSCVTTGGPAWTVLMTNHPTLIGRLSMRVLTLTVTAALGFTMAPGLAPTRAESHSMDALRVDVPVRTPSVEGSAELPSTQLPAPGALWMAIGQTPTAGQIRALAPRYAVVVLNAWALDAKTLIRQINPKMIVLVYKDLSSTRSYSGAVDAGHDALLLPSGVGYVEASSHPTWFATDAAGHRIQWGPYPGHWQMSVWLPEALDREPCAQSRG